MTEKSYLRKLLTLPVVLSAYGSPDQRWVAFNWYRVHENIDVFVVPSDGSAPPIPLTHTPNATSFVSWTADSRSLVVMEDRDGDERDRLYRVDLDRPGEMHLLTDEDPQYFVRGGELDGDRLYYGANFDFAAGRETEETRVYRQDLRTGERTQLSCPLKPVFMTIELNHQGTFLLYCRKDRHPAGRQYWLVDVEGRNDREILNFGDDAKVTARWLPDGRHILVLSDSTGRALQQHQSVGVYDIHTDEIRWLIDDPTRTIEGAWVTPDGLVIVDEMIQASHQPVFIDPQSGIETPFPRLAGNLLPIGRSLDGAWLGIYYSATQPQQVVRFDLEAHEESDLHCLTPAWDYSTLHPSELTPAESYSWPSSDGLRIHGWLYRASHNPRRAILFVHGGPTYHSENRMNAQIQYFVQRGFNVLDVNYRGSTGYGLKFREMIKEDGWGGREQDDITFAARALIADGLAEPGKVGVTGTSYGGYSSWYQVTHADPDLIGASAPICGMTDLVVDYETTRPDLRPYSEEMIGGKPDEVPQRYYERSPIHFVQNIRARLLIVQGARDPNVTPANVREVIHKLEEHDVPFDLLVFDDEGHGILKPSNQEVLYKRLADFFTF